MIQNITIENFLNFKKFEAPRLAGINLLIGDNDTGKTGLLKLLYAVSKTWEIYSRQHSHGSPSFKKVLSEKIFDTFQPRSRNKIGEFVTKGTKEKLKVEVTYQTDKVHQNISFQFGETTKKTINNCTDSVAMMGNNNNVIFIPAKEVLTACRAIKFTREQHYLAGFDDTYLDLIRMLEVPTLDSAQIGPLNNINQQLEALLGGSIYQTDDDFLFKRGSQEFTMAMTAEGFKKMGILTTLIRNRQLNTGTLLFLDEPETALHPRAIRHFSKIIVRLAALGVQIFLTTHNYFIIKQLYICARKEKTSIFCFSLLNEQDSIDTHFADLKESMPRNPIVDEALDMFDEDVALDLGL